jgi:hypothetical protein
MEKSIPKGNRQWRVVDNYGEIQYNLETYHIGEKYAGQRIALCDNPICFRHTRTKAKSLARIQNRKPCQLTIKKTSTKVGIKEESFFCWNIHELKPATGKMLNNKRGIHSPVSYWARMFIIIFSANKYLTLTFVFIDSIKKMFSGFLFKNKMINGFRERKKSIYHFPKLQSNENISSYNKDFI